MKNKFYQEVKIKCRRKYSLFGLFERWEGKRILVLIEVILSESVPLSQEHFDAIVLRTYKISLKSYSRKMDKKGKG